MTYFKQGKTIPLHQELDITDEMAELGGVSLSSADIETKVWLGQKWFKSFLAAWVVNELPSGTPLMEIKKRYLKAIERDISYTDLCSLLPQKVLFDSHTCNSSQSFFYYIGTARQHGSHHRVGELESVLSDFLRSREYHKAQMRRFNADLQGASEESLVDENSQHRTRATIPTDTKSSRITPVHWKNHRGFSSNGIDSDQNTASTRGEQEGNCTTMMNFDITESDGRYTLALKEKGDQESVIPRYDEMRQREYPPLWVVIVTYNDITEAGQAKSKKEAKHLASKKAWYKLGGREI